MAEEELVGVKCKHFMAEAYMFLSKHGKSF
jgi:hypothetical protein